MPLTNTVNTREVQIMQLHTKKEIAFSCLSKNAQLKIRLDEATTLEGKLFCCLQAEFIPGVQYFLAQGANPNLPVYGGAESSAIYFAESSPKAMMLLLAYGANQDAQNQFGWTIVRSIYSRYDEKGELDDDEKKDLEACLQILAQNGANFQLPTSNFQIKRDAYQKS